jgi:hypothetical protein
MLLPVLVVAHAGDIGTVDHQPMPYPTPRAFATFFDPSYHDVVSYLHDRLTAIVGARAPQLAGHGVWLSEANSVCHQGTFNVTNAFANSLWLLDRLGLMAAAGVQLMARQSLIGCVQRELPRSTGTHDVHGCSASARTYVRAHRLYALDEFRSRTTLLWLCVCVVALPSQIQLLAFGKFPRRAADAVA